MSNNIDIHWKITQVEKNEYGNIDGYVAEKPGSSTWHIPIHELQRQLLLGLNKFFVYMDGQMYRIYSKHLSDEHSLNEYDRKIRNYLLSLPLSKRKGKR